MNVQRTAIPITLGLILLAATAVLALLLLVGLPTARAQPSGCPALTIEAGSDATVTKGAYASVGIPTGSGGRPPLSYDVSGEPPGMSYSSGSVSGTPTTTGTYTVSVRVWDSCDDSDPLSPRSLQQSASTSFNIKVVDPPPPPTPTDTPTPTPTPIPPPSDPLSLAQPPNMAGTLNVAFKRTVPQAAGGDPPYDYEMRDLPSGLDFDETDFEIEGTPRVTGRHTVEYEVTDDAGDSVERTFTITITAPPLALAKPSDMTGQVDVEFEEDVPQATGGDPPLLYTMRDLPPGLEFSTDDFKIDGTPTTAGTYKVKYSVTDERGDPKSPRATVSHTFTITIARPPLGLDRPDDMAGTRAVYFEESVPQATGGKKPYSYRMRNLPSGLEFDSTAFTISGTPETSGRYTTTYSVTDSSSTIGPLSARATVEQSFTITISEPPKPVLASVGEMTGMVGVYFDADVPEATSGVRPYEYSMDNLPPGLTFSDTAFDITGIPTTAGTYAVSYQVTDKADSTTTSAFTITIQPPPEVTIVRDSVATAREGAQVTFSLSSSVPFQARTTVNLVMEEQTGRGKYLTGTLPPVTFAIGSQSASFVISTENDKIDEYFGTITAKVLPPPLVTRYTVGTPGSAVVTMQDDDVPPVPGRLRANGDIDENVRMALRWDAIPSDTQPPLAQQPPGLKYEVRYTVETCSEYVESNTMALRARCTGDTNNWITPASTTGLEYALGGFTLRTSYRVQVRAVIVDEGDWSDPVFIYPTALPLGRGVDILTAPYHGYIPRNAAGSHDFRYGICSNTVLPGLSLSISAMESAIESWEREVIWNRGGGANIITTTPYSLSGGYVCRPDTTFSLEPKQIVVKFVSEDYILEECRGSSPAIACWRSSSWTDIGMNPIRRGAVLLNADKSLSTWNKVLAGGCTRLAELLVHEVGHGFGIGGVDLFAWDWNKHPLNDELSIMSYAADGRYCTPQAYDIAAIMALYQSR